MPITRTEVRPHHNNPTGFAAPSAPGARLPRVREVDFRRPSKFPRDQIRRLQTAHESFCRSASSRLSAELRTSLQLDVIGTDQLPYSTVMAEEVPPHALVTVLEVEPLGTEIVLILEMQLALALVDRLLGGAGVSSSSVSGMTEVEVAVARRALASLVEPLSDAWLDFADVQLSISSTSTLPTSVQIAPASEPSLLLNFQVDVDGLFSILTVCMPHRSVAPLMDRLEQAHYGAPSVDGETAAALHSAMRGVEVELRAEVGSIDMTVEQVLALRAGDTVPLERKVSDGATLLAANVPAYQVRPGRNGRSRAVQVGGRWSEVT